MPPKAKISKEMILNTVLDITRESGFETVNARSIANKLQCSTRPIFTCYENMEELKKEFLTFAYEYYKQYVIHYQTSAHTPFCLLLPLSYLEFADREPHLFKLLFVNECRTFLRVHGIGTGKRESHISGSISLYPRHRRSDRDEKNSSKQRNR